MKMQDDELLACYDAAPDKQEAIRELANRNLVDTWDMRCYLMELGAKVDGRWFQNLNPNRQKKPKDYRFPVRDAGTDREPQPNAGYLKKIVDEQARQLTEATERIRELEAENGAMKEQNAALTAQARELGTAGEKLNRTNEALEAERDALREQVNDLEIRCGELSAAQEPPACCGDLKVRPTQLDIMREFVDELVGVEAWAMGDALDEILGWCSGAGGDLARAVRLLTALDRQKGDGTDG